MPIKISTMFQFQNQGWSETHYQNYSLEAFNMDQYATTTYNRRRPLLAGNVQIVGFRASDLANPRRVKVKRVGWTGSYPVSISDPTASSDFGFVSVIAAMGSADGFKRTVYLRGVPDSVTDARYRVIVNSDWVAAFGLWADWMVGGLFGCWAMDPTDNPPTQITNITVVDKKIRITADWSGFIDGEPVRISRLVSSPPLNGVWRIRKIDDANFDLIGSDTALTAIPFDFGGVVRSQRHSLHTIMSCGQKKITAHKTGRPFDQPRSRRRKAAPKLPTSLMGSY